MRRNGHDESRSEGGAALDADSVEGDDGDAAAAFEALRAQVEALASTLRKEIATIGRGVELTLEQIEAQGAPVDYGTDLGRLVHGLGAVSDRLRAVELAPALRQETGEMVRQFERQARVLELIDSQIAARFTDARRRWRQNLWLGGAGAAGIVVGVVLTLLVPRVLPFSLAERTAVTVMGQRAWEAGRSLMKFADPEAVNWIYAAQELVRANAATVTSCRAAVAKTGKEQSCTIVVPVPGRSLEMIRP